tara:strand:+ start:4063 stop:6201 length:2139 start_codon:yes stop_codon:yes gene_type:complete
MGRTLLELFHDSEFKESVKSDTETLVGQETSGIRVKSAVELNNPLIYGNEATRIVNKSTSVLEDMKKGTSGTEFSGGDGGLIGKGIGKLTGGKLNSIGDVRDKVNSKLGIPSNQIPSRVVKGLDKEHNSQTPVVPGENGTELGKLLKESGGNPSTIGKQALGKGIGAAKDSLRGELFGKGADVGTAKSSGGLGGKEYAILETNNTITYSDANETKRLKSAKTVKEDLEGTKLDLSKVSPIYGLKRDNGIFGKSPGEVQKETYGFISRDKSELSRFSTLKPYNGKDKKPAMESSYRLGTKDGINTILPSDDYTMEKDAFIKVGEDVYKDFIPVWFKKHGSEKPIVFRAIISGLSETTSPSWSSNKFIGNPYSFYMYDGVERSLAFNIKLFASSPLELVGMWDRLKILTSYTYPTINGGLATPPIIQFRIGSIYSGKAGFIESLTYSIPDESNWETNGELGWLPKMIDASVGIKFIETQGDEDRLYDMDISKAAVKTINDERQANSDMESSRTDGESDTPNTDEVATVEAKKSVAGELGPIPKLKSLSGDKQQEETAIPPKEGEVNPIKSQSATADAFDGKSPTVAARDFDKEHGAAVAAFIVERKVQAPTSTLEVVPRSALPSWVIDNIPWRFRLDYYQSIIKQSAFIEKLGKEITEYHVVQNSTNSRLNFANSYEDDPAEQPSEEERKAEIAEKNKKRQEEFKRTGVWPKRF